jgi:hypothetical protein
LPLASSPTTLPRYPSSVWISFLHHASISGRGLEFAAVSPDDFEAVGPDETSSHSEQLKVSACHAWMLVMHKSSYLQENCQWPNTLHKSSYLQETADGRSVNFCEFFSACIFRSFTRLYLLYNLKIFLLFFLSSFFQNSKGIYRSGNEQTQSCGNAQTQSSRNAEAKPLNPSMPLTKILASRL